MIVLKEDSMPTVWKEVLALMKINPEDRIRCHWGNREQVYSWANGIEYEYMAEKVKKKEILNVVICYETWEEDHSRTSGEKEEKHTRYAWLSSHQINHKNVFFRCTKIGRYRWKIENNILVEKHQGYEYEHCFSYSWNAMKGFHYLMKIGHFLNVLALNSELLADKVKELGIRGFIKYLTLACEGSVLDKNRVNVLIIGDSIYSRNRSKVVEILARVRDHVAQKYVKGFRLLTLGWSDGNPSSRSASTS